MSPCQHSFAAAPQDDWEAASVLLHDSACASGSIDAGPGPAVCPAPAVAEAGQLEDLELMQALSHGQGPFSREVAAAYTQAAQALSTTGLADADVLAVASALGRQGYELRVRRSPPGAPRGRPGVAALIKLCHVWLEVRAPAAAADSEASAGDSEPEAASAEAADSGFDSDSDPATPGPAGRRGPAAAAAGRGWLVVDPRLRELLTIPRPDFAYAALLAALPDVFVGCPRALAAVLALACAAMERSFARSGISVPPWRQQSLTLHKWGLTSGAGEVAIFGDAGAGTPPLTFGAAGALRRASGQADPSPSKGAGARPGGHSPVSVIIVMPAPWGAPVAGTGPCSPAGGGLDWPVDSPSAPSSSAGSLSPAGARALSLPNAAGGWGGRPSLGSYPSTPRGSLSLAIQQATEEAAAAKASKSVSPPAGSESPVGGAAPRGGDHDALRLVTPQRAPTFEGWVARQRPPAPGGLERIESQAVLGEIASPCSSIPRGSSSSSSSSPASSPPHRDSDAAAGPASGSRGPAAAAAAESGVPAGGSLRHADAGSASAAPEGCVRGGNVIKSPASLHGFDLARAPAAAAARTPSAAVAAPPRSLPLPPLMAGRAGEPVRPALHMTHVAHGAASHVALRPGTASGRLSLDGAPPPRPGAAARPGLDFLPLRALMALF